MKIIKKFNAYAAIASIPLSLLTTTMLEVCLRSIYILNGNFLEELGILFILIINLLLTGFIMGWLFADLEIKK